MKRTHITLWVLFFIAGCSANTSLTSHTSRNSVMHTYLSEVKTNDGINYEEAIILARSELYFRGLQSRYYIERPSVYALDAESWIVEFEPINKTFAQIQENQSILFIVNRKSGKVLHRRES